MKKIMTLAAVALVAVAANAQTFKFGNFNSSKVLREMPESTQAVKELEDLQSSYETEISKMGEEYQKKIADYVAARDSLPESIANARAEEIQQLEQRIQTFREQAARDLQQKQQQKMAPIIDKLNKAIQAVGEKNGFTYIFEVSDGGVLYFSPAQCVDVEPLVRAELGMK